MSGGHHAVTTWTFTIFAAPAVPTASWLLFVVTPVKPLQKLALKIIDHWETGYGSQYNRDAQRNGLPSARFATLSTTRSSAIERETGAQPILIATSARPAGKRTSFVALKDMLNRQTRPFLLLFGTGWGLTETILSQADYTLEAIEGSADFNHLSGALAAAIILDRLLGWPVINRSQS